MLYYTLLFPGLLFLYYFYGFIYACFLTRNDEELVALSLPTAFAVLAFCSLTSLLLGVDYYPTSLILAIALPIALLFVQARRTSIRDLYSNRLRSFFSYVRRHRPLFVGYGLLVLHYFSQQALVPFYGLGNLPGDWFGHYRITEEFLTHTVPTFPHRLPLYHVLQALNLSLLGSEATFGVDFYVFQLGQLLMAAAMLPVASLLFKRFSGERDTLPILLATAMLPYILIQSLYTWPKMMATVFSLLAFHFYLNLRDNNQPKRNLIMSGLFNGLSVASHWLGLVYFAAILLDLVRVQLSSSSPRKVCLRGWFKMVLLALLVLAPIYVWGILQFGVTDTLYAGWSLLQKSDYTLAEHLLIRVMNFFTTLFLPLSILIGLFRELPMFGFSKMGGFDLLVRGFSWHFGSLLGNMGISITVFLLVSFIRYAGKAKLHSIWEKMKNGLHNLVTHEASLVFYIICGFLLWVLVQSYPHTYGLSLTGLTPSLILLFGLILSKIQNQKRLKYLLTFLFFESTLVIWGWQEALHYLQATYKIQIQTSDPALMLLNEVIQYRSQYNLYFLFEAIGESKIFPVVTGIVSEIGIFVILLRAIRNNPTAQTKR